MHSPIIGLEIHTELNTRSKMFCSCTNNPDEEKSNVNVCPICLGHPGTLPVINKEAVRSVIKLGLTVGGNISRRSHFDRKSYFYPDLPKGYQISQYKSPLVEGGMLCDVRIRRIHLEEDTARLLHVARSNEERIKTNEKQIFNGNSVLFEKNSDEDFSLVDFNRAGIPLMELVTEPDIKSGREAVNFAKSLQRIMRALNISDADMEKGQMRIEANISIRPNDERINENLGTKVEIKNLNSFRAMEEAILYEISRQIKILESGGRVSQETRGWDDKKKVTISQRSKESEHDYRYFPEPDLPQLSFTDDEISAIRDSIPELPDEKKKRFEKELGIRGDQIEIFLDDVSLANYFEESVSELGEKTREPNVQLLFNYLTSDIKGLLKTKGIGIGELKISPEHFAHLIALIQAGILSSRLAKDLLLEMHKTGEDPETLMGKEGVLFVGDEEKLRPVVDEIIDANPKAVLAYRSGKENALQFLIGQAMSKTKGQADPEKLRKLFIEKISGS